MAVITQTELIDGAGFVNLGQPATINNLVARTYMYYGKPTSVENPGVLCIKGDSASAGGPRFQISSSNNNVQLVTPTSGSVLVPSLRGATGSVTLGQWVNLAASWDGVNPVNTHGKLYKEGVLEAAPEVSSGASPYQTGDGFDFWMFNRPGTTRATLGSHAYLAIWNRVLSDAEVLQAKTEGPLSVPSGLVLCWANGQDYGPYNITPVARSTFAAGDLPPNTALGDSAPPAEVAGTMSVTESGVDSCVATGTVTSLENLSLVASGDSFNAHPTNSSISNPATATPTVNIVVRVVYSNWRQFLFKLQNASGKRPLFRIDPTGYVNSFNASWRPWYSYDGIAWSRFDTPPVNNTTTWDFQHSTAFTGGDVWVAYQPAWPVWRVPWLIGQLQALDSSIIHALPSAPGFEYPTTMTAQTNELGSAVPGQKMYGFGVWDDAVSPLDGSAKRNVLITGGVHAGEHVGNWAMEGFLRYLCGGSAKALELLKNYRFFVYPMLNPMGRYMGHYRGQRDPAGLLADPNRDYPGDNSASVLQSSTFFRNMLTTDLGAQKLAFSLDFHGTWGSATSFYYYSDPSVDPNAGYLDEWHARLQAYSTGYARMSSDLTTTVDQYTSRNYGQKHSYIPEMYESSAFAAGTDALLTIGGDYAKALSDCPLSEMVLPQETQSTGVMMVTEPGTDVISASGKVAVLGVLSVSEPGQDAFSGYADLLVAGTMAVAESGSDFLSALGQLLVSGFLSVSETGIDSALTLGVVPARGAMSVSESGADTLVAYGAGTMPSSTGTMATMETGADSVTGSGKVKVTGSAALVEFGSDTMSSLGQLFVSGLLSASEVGPDFLVSVGNVPAHGQMAAAESGADMFEALGRVTDTAQIDASEVFQVVRCATRHKSVAAEIRSKKCFRHASMRQVVYETA